MFIDASLIFDNRGERVIAIFRNSAEVSSIFLNEFELISNLIKGYSQSSDGESKHLSCARLIHPLMFIDASLLFDNRDDQVIAMFRNSAEVSSKLF